MIILVQASYFIYELAVQLGSIMTSTTLTLISSNFFNLTLDSIINIGLEMLLGVFYVLTLFITCLILIIRYAIVAIGVALFPLGIFFYFVQPLKPYGVLLLHFLGVAVFVTFLDGILLVGFSRLIEISLFANTKILVMISAFSLINAVMFFLMFFSILKAAFSMGTKIAALVAKVAV